MKAWVVEGYGTLDRVSIRDVRIPVVPAGCALVRVLRAGLNFADVISVRGEYQVRTDPPFILGAEIAGQVVDTGGFAHLAFGDLVMAQVTSGAYAEYCAVDAARLIRLAPATDPTQAAAIPISYTTASIALFDTAGLRAGETVLIHAAAGGTGIAATQLARNAGARVIAATAAPEKAAVATANGASAIVNNRAADWVETLRGIAPGGIDVVLDPVGGDITLQSVRALAWGGRLLIVGFASGAIPAIPANRLLVKAASARGVFWKFDVDPSGIAAVQRELATALAEGTIRPIIGATVPFAALKEGLVELAGGRTIGKLVLDVENA
jgi:NADPH:quinone reductase